MQNLVAFSKLNLDSSFIKKNHFSICQNSLGRYNHKEKSLHSLERAYHVSAYKATRLTDVTLWSQGYNREKVSCKNDRAYYCLGCLKLEKLSQHPT